MSCIDPHSTPHDHAHVLGIDRCFAYDAYLQDELKPEKEDSDGDSDEEDEEEEDEDDEEDEDE